MYFKIERKHPDLICSRKARSHYSMFNQLKINIYINPKLSLARSYFFLWVVVWGTFASIATCNAQLPEQGASPLPEGVFLTDSIEIGKPVLFSLRFVHPAQREVFFPDSTFNFGTFQVVSQQNFPSKTNTIGTLDSTIYELISFDVASIQILSVPVYLYDGKDSTALLTKPDSIFLR